MITKPDDKIDILVNKISKLESTLFEEKKLRIKAEDELDDLNKITIPSLNKDLEEKEALIKEIMIDRIGLEKELSLIKDSLNDSSLSKVGKLIIPEFQDDKDQMIIKQENKIDYLTAVYSQLKKVFNKAKDELAKCSLDYETKLKIEKEKNEVLIKQSKEDNMKIATLNKELASLAGINSNLCIENKTLSSLLMDYSSEKEKYQVESLFYKREYETQIKTLNDSLTRTKRLDSDYQVVIKTLEEYKTRLSQVDTKTYIFQVINIGRVIESSAEIVFYKEGRTNYFVSIKYMTSSLKYNILEIEDIIQVEAAENVIEISFKKEKNEANEQFRTNEGVKVISVFKDFQKRAHQYLDVRKQEKTDKMKQKQMKKNVDNMFNIFGV